MSNLMSYLERKTAALKAARAGASTDPVERRQHLTAQVIAEGGSGVRRVRIRDFQIITDAGPAMAGYDLGPRAPEVLLGALGSCISHTVLIQAAIEGLQIDELAVDVSCDVDSLAGHADVQNPLTNIAFEIRVDSPEPAAAFERINALLPDICPVLNVVQFAQSVTAKVIHNGAQATAAAD
jgi:uncharacterized OsmC-like protein